MNCKDLSLLAVFSKNTNFASKFLLCLNPEQAALVHRLNSYMLSFI